MNPCFECEKLNFCAILLSVNMSLKSCVVHSATWCGIPWTWCRYIMSASLALSSIILSSFSLASCAANTSNRFPLPVSAAWALRCFAVALCLLAQSLFSLFDANVDLSKPARCIESPSLWTSLETFHHLGLAFVTTHRSNATPCSTWFANGRSFKYREWENAWKTTRERPFSLLSILPPHTGFQPVYRSEGVQFHQQACTLPRKLNEALIILLYLTK